MKIDSATILPCLVLVMVTAFFIYQFYSDGTIFPPKMPSNYAELDNWDEFDLGRLRGSLDCGLIPVSKGPNEALKMKQWREACIIVNGYWRRAANASKQKDADQKARNITLPPTIVGQ